MSDRGAPDQDKVIALDRVQEPDTCGFPHQAFRAISRDCPAHFLTDDKGHARLFKTVRSSAEDYERVTPGSPLLPHPLHVGFGLEPPSALDTHLVLRRNYLMNFLARLTPTVRRRRPLARRAFRTFRPPLLCIFFRKPCTRKRCRRLG